MEKVLNLFDDQHWENADEYFNGTLRKVLRDEEGYKTILLRLPKNFKMAPHTHLVTEQNFVVDGQYTYKGEVYAKGTYQIFRPHDEHGPFESKEGATILVIWDK